MEKIKLKPKLRPMKVKTTLKEPEDGKDVVEEKVDETIRDLNVEADRITYHVGRKVSDDNNGNITLGLTYSSSVRRNESLDKATSRVIDYTESKVTQRIAEIVD